MRGAAFCYCLWRHTAQSLLFVFCWIWQVGGCTMMSLLLLSLFAHSPV